LGAAGRAPAGLPPPLPPPPAPAALDVRVLTGGASSGLGDGFGCFDSVELLPCRPDEPAPSAGRDEPDDADDDDLSPPDFLDEPPPNSRLKKPGLLSPLLDMLRVT